jgi:hypothetical protein
LAVEAALLITYGSIIYLFLISTIVMATHTEIFYNFPPSFQAKHEAVPYNRS